MNFKQREYFLIWLHDSKIPWKNFHTSQDAFSIEIEQNLVLNHLCPDRLDRMVLDFALLNTEQLAGGLLVYTQFSMSWIFFLYWMRRYTDNLALIEYLWKMLTSISANMNQSLCILSCQIFCIPSWYSVSKKSSRFKCTFYMFGTELSILCLCLHWNRSHNDKQFTLIVF